MTNNRKYGSPREKNPNWNGGESITSHGYRTINIGGKYKYEHRLVMEEKLGRKLKQAEIVHHVNGDKLDNRPENLIVCKNLAEHKLRHRTKTGLRLPNEPNRKIKCVCGCGKKLFMYDNSGRPRRHLPGHRSPPVKIKDFILKSIESGILTVEGMADNSHYTIRVVSITASWMARKGIIVKIKPGVYGLLGSKSKKELLVSCECGCGEKIHQYDEYWRKRRFVSGHNRPPIIILTENDVLYIRQNPEKMSRKVLANKFGVNYNTICAVISGRIWKHLL